MTLPVQPPGGYHNGAASSRGFPHKRLPYGGGGGGGGSFLKKHPHMPSTATSPAAGAAGSAGGATASAGGGPAGAGQQQHAPAKPSNAAAQASAVAAATTAVAAAKAAAQSAANATTNPGILAQVSKLPHIKQEEASEDSTTGTPELMTSSNGGDSATEHSSSATLDASLRLLKQESKPDGELSEISDSDDDILNKTDKVKPKCELQLDGALAGAQEVSTDALSTSEEAIKCEPQTPASSASPTTTSPTTAVAAAQTGAGAGAGAGAGEAAGAAVAGGSAASLSGGIKVEGVDEVLDFEEISDGELEEDARHKGKSNKSRWTAKVPTD